MLLAQGLGEGDAVLIVIELDIEEDEIGLFPVEQIERLGRRIGDPRDDKTTTTQGSLKIPSGDTIVLDDHESQAVGGKFVHEVSRRGEVRRALARYSKIPIINK